MTDARPTSGFAAAVTDTERAKDGRKLGGATNPRFTSEYWTPERREEQRQKIKQLMAEGKVGGQNGFHRRKTKKFQEIAAEAAQKRADEIVGRLMAMIFGQNGDKRLQLEAIRELAKFEDWSVKNSREDEKAFRSMTNAQLDTALVEMMGEALGLDLSTLGDAEGEVVSEEMLELSELTDEELAEIGYDPMDSELGGDRLREAAEEADVGD